MTPEEFDALDDGQILAELQRRMDRDTGIRHDLDDVIARSGITRKELEDDE